MDNHNVEMPQEEMNKEFKLSCEINAKFRAAQQKFWAEVQSTVPVDPAKLFQVTPEEEEEEALYKDAVARLEVATDEDVPHYEVFNGKGPKCDVKAAQE